MIVTSQFKVDLFQLKHTHDPEGLMQAIKRQNATELGHKIIELFPYEKTHAFEGTLPEMSVNREHEFTDTWGVELVVITRDDFSKIMKVMREVDRIGRHDLAMEVKDIFNRQ